MSMIGSILRDLFADVAHGRLQRVAFLLYVLAGMILLMPIAFLFAGIASLQATSSVVLKWFIYPLIAVFAFVGCNLAAKRIRDIGLPGWSTLIAVNLLSFGLLYVAPEIVAQAANVVIWASLVLMPSGTIQLRRRLKSSITLSARITRGPRCQRNPK
jgi:uncharacterized membrane protein YhaH (DUF805 family)